MKALMQRHEAKQVGWRFGGCGGAFTGPKEGGKVVSLVADGSFAEIETLGAHLMLKEAASQLEVGVGDGAGAVSRGKLTLYMQRKRVAPHDGRWCGAKRVDGSSERVAGNGVGHRKQHAPGTGFGSIMGPMDGWLKWNELGQAGGAGVKLMMDNGKIGQDLVQVGREADPRGTGVGAKGVLQQAKQTARAGEGDRH